MWLVIVCSGVLAVLGVMLFLEISARKQGKRHLVYRYLSSGKTRDVLRAPFSKRH